MAEPLPIIYAVTDHRFGLDYLDGKLRYVSLDIWPYTWRSARFEGQSIPDDIIAQMQGHVQRHKLNPAPVRCHICSPRTAHHRYGVYLFPSADGTPWYFRRRFVASFAAVVRKALHVGVAEIRLIDSRTNEHLLVF